MQEGIQKNSKIYLNRLVTGSVYKSTFELLQTLPLCSISFYIKYSQMLHHIMSVFT